MIRSIRTLYLRLADLVLPSVSAKADRCENVRCFNDPPGTYNCHVIDTGRRLEWHMGRC